MAVKTNKDKLMKQVLLGKIAPPVMFVQGGLIGAYMTTWDGKPKIGVGVGGIKYNVKVGDSCYGWPETEYLSPCTFMKKRLSKNGFIACLSVGEGPRL